MLYCIWSSRITPLLLPSSFFKRANFKIKENLKFIKQGIKMSKDTLKRFFKPHTSKAQHLSLDELNPSEYCIIDVRKKSIFHSTPHIKGAINISDLDELICFCHQNPSKKILLTCNGGLRASKYGNQLIQSGLKQIYFLDEYLQRIQEYLPLEETRS